MVVEQVVRRLLQATSAGQGGFGGGEEPLQDSSRSMTQLAGTSIGQTWTAPGTSRPQERGTRGLVDWWAPDVKVGRN